jgi:hypothetical protein
MPFVSGRKSFNHPDSFIVRSRGVWTSDGSFEPIPALDSHEIMLLFRHRVLQNPSGEVCLKTYNYHEVFEEVDKRLSENPVLRLYAFSQLLPTVK